MLLLTASYQDMAMLEHINILYVHAWSFNFYYFNYLQAALLFQAAAFCHFGTLPLLLRLTAY